MVQVHFTVEIDDANANDPLWAATFKAELDWRVEKATNTVLRIMPTRYRDAVYEQQRRLMEEAKAAIKLAEEEAEKKRQQEQAEWRESIRAKTAEAERLCEELKAEFMAVLRERQQANIRPSINRKRQEGETDDDYTKRLADESNAGKDWDRKHT